MLTGAHLAAESGPWTFGWESLVAIGTICLACVTGWLAFTTRDVARSARDETAAAWRPVVVDGGPTTIKRHPLLAEFVLEMSLKNAGAGVALQVRAQSAMNSVTNTPGVQIGVMPQSEDKAFELPVPPATDAPDDLPSTVRVLVDYVDIAGRPSSTVIDYALLFGDRPGAMAVAQIKVYEGRHLSAMDVTTKIRTSRRLPDLPA